MNTLWKILTRRKVLDVVQVAETRLARVLTCFDLTALGVGSTLGVGVYVLAGKVAKDSAGPAVILSFLIAAVASVFAGLSYAEFGARAPRAGSAYIYSYVCVGEFIAFVIGWNLILEYVIGSASVARGFSLYLDTLLNNTLKDTFIEVAPINLPYMSSYFDFMAFCAVMLLTIGLAFGMKESTIANNIVTSLNIFVVLFVVIAGSLKADLKNWNLPAPQNVTGGGKGGFFPFGFAGVLKGAATCFYGFVGFDCIATTGEEVKNPQKAIPLAIILSLLIVFLAYFGTSTIITLLLPYYLQDVNAPIPRAFEELGWDTAKWVVTIGGMFGLCASLFGAMFPLPRIIYAMASDGLIFKFLGIVHQRFSSPVIGTITAGILTGLMAAMFELDQLVNMMSIGTLLAYTIVSACVLLLRYAVDEEVNYSLIRSSSSESDMYTDNGSSLSSELPINSDIDENELIEKQVVTCANICKQIFNYQKSARPTKVSEKLATLEVYIYCFLSLMLGLGAIYLTDPISQGELWAIILMSTVGLMAIFVLLSLAIQPHSTIKLSFKVPFVPLIPALSILINIYLMLMLDVTTWIRFGVWMTLGVLVYFFSVRQYSKAQNNSVIKTYVNGFKSNDLANTASLDVVFEEKLIDALPQWPPETEETRESVLLTEELVVADLDNIILREEQNRRLSYVNPFYRKISIDTLSTSSNAYYEENVVAIVHREDAYSLPVTPHSDIPYPIPECAEESIEHLPSVEERNEFDDVNVDNKTLLPSIIKSEAHLIAEFVEKLEDKNTKDSGKPKNDSIENNEKMEHMQDFDEKTIEFVPLSIGRLEKIENASNKSGDEVSDINIPPAPSMDNFITFKNEPPEMRNHKTNFSAENKICEQKNSAEKQNDSQQPIEGKLIGSKQFENFKLHLEMLMHPSKRTQNNQIAESNDSESTDEEKLNNVRVVEDEERLEINDEAEESMSKASDIRSELNTIISKTLQSRPKKTSFKRKSENEFKTAHKALMHSTLSSIKQNRKYSTDENLVVGGNNKNGPITNTLSDVDNNAEKTIDFRRDLENLYRDKLIRNGLGGKKPKINPKKQKKTNNPPITITPFNIKLRKSESFRNVPPIINKKEVELNNIKLKLKPNKAIEASEGAETYFGIKLKKVDSLAQ